MNASPTSAPPPDHPGARVGPYRLERLLGRGGQGEVHLAHDPRLARRVALKVIPRTEAAAGALVRLRREAELLAGLSHPGLRPVLDYGEADGFVYVAFPYLAGETLAARLARPRSADAGGAASEATVVERGAASPASEAAVEVDATQATRPEDASSATPTDRREIDRLLAIFERLARALHVAHEAGIVHRDVKPANLFLTADGEPVVLDFGLARAFEDDAGLTQTGAVLGTPAYLAPECATGLREADRRSDVWSLGVSLYECLTGRRPFVGPGRDAVLRAVREATPTDPRRLNRALPADLALVLAVALEKEPGRRYVSAAAFADDLAAVRERRPVAAKPVGPLGRVARYAVRAPAAFALAVTLIVAPTAAAVLVALRAADRPRVLAEEAARRAAARDDAVARAYLLLLDARISAAAAAFEALDAAQPDEPETLAGAALAALELERPAAMRRAARRLPGGSAAQADLLFAADRLERLLDEAASASAPTTRLAPDAAAAPAAAAASSAAAATTRPDPASRPAPQTALDHFVRGRLSLPRGPASDGPQYRPALDALRRAVLLSARPRSEHFASLAHAAGRSDDLPTARAAAAALVAHWPDSPGALRAAALGLGLAGGDAEALPLFARAAALEPGETSVYVNYAASLAELGRSDEAIEVLRGALQRLPGDPELRLALGEQRLARRESAEALQLFEALLAQDPPYAPAYGGKAKTLAALGRAAEATEPAREALRRGSPDGDVALAFAHGLRAQGESAELLRFLERATPKHPRRADLRALHARALHQAGRLDEAEEKAEEVLRLDPRHPTALAIRGIRRFHRGEIADAEQDLRALRAADPNALHSQLVRILLETGRAASAARVAAESAATASRRSLAGPYVEARLLEADALLHAGRAAEALAAAVDAEARAAGRQSFVARRTRIVALAAGGDREGAERLLRESLAADPRLPDDLAAYASGVRDAGRVDLALAAAEVVVRVRPDPVSLVQLAMLRYGRGEFDAAAVYAAQAEDLVDASPRRDETTWRRKRAFAAARDDARRTLDAAARGALDAIPERPAVALRALLAAGRAVDAVAWWRDFASDPAAEYDPEDGLVAALAAARVALDEGRPAAERDAAARDARTWAEAARVEGMRRAAAGELGARAWRRALRAVEGDSFFAALPVVVRELTRAEDAGDGPDEALSPRVHDARRLERFLLGETLRAEAARPTR